MSSLTIDAMLLRCRAHGERLRALTRSAAIRRAALVLAALMFAGGLYFSFSDLTVSPDKIEWRPLIWLIGLGIPASIALNTLVTELAASMVGFRFGLRRALVITIFGSAANMLPLPGAAMVRIAGLKAAGASLGASSAATATTVLLWIGMAFTYSGAFLVVIRPWFGAGALVIGIGSIAAGLLWTRYLSRGWLIGLKILAIKSLMILTSVLRIQLCFAVIGIAASFHQVSIFAISDILGSAVSIVPAGLGVREAASAGLAPLVHLTASAAFLATAVDRIVAMAMLMILTLGLSAANIRPGGRAVSNHGEHINQVSH